MGQALMRNPLSLNMLDSCFRRNDSRRNVFICIIMAGFRQRLKQNPGGRQFLQRQENRFSAVERTFTDCIRIKLYKATG